MTTRTIHYGQDVLLGDRSHRDHLLLAGVGYGKTWFGPPWHFKRCLENPKSKESIVIAPTYKLLKDRCLQDYLQFLLDIGFVEGQHYRANRSEPSISFPWGHKVIFLSGEAPNRIVSYTISHAWLDEAALLDEQVRKNVIKRLRCPNALYRQMLYTTTPEGLNWLFDLFHPDKLHRGENEVISRSESKLVLHGRSLDNPYLDEEYFQMLMDEFGFDSAYYANYVLGEWTSLSKNRFYFSFSDGLNVKDVELDRANRQLYLSFDNNVGCMTWATMQDQPVDENIAHCVLADNGANGRNIQDACEQFIQAYPPEDYKNYFITVLGDAALHARSPHSYQTGYQIIEGLLKPHYPLLKIAAHHGNPFVEERSRNTNRLFANKKLFISKRCRKVIMSAKTTESDGKGGVKKPSGDVITHPMEAVDMALMVIDPPKVKRYGAGGFNLQ